MNRCAGAAAAALGALLMSACVVLVEPAAVAASGGRASANPGNLTESDWPARLVRDDADNLGVIYSLGNVRTRNFRVGPYTSRLLGPSMALAYERYRVIAPPLWGDTRTLTVDGEGDLDTLIVGPPIRFGASGSVRVDAQPGGDAHTETFVFVSAVQGPPDEAGESNDPTLEMQRTWYQLVEPAHGQPRAVVVVLPGMFGTPEPVIDRFVRKLRREDYAVVRFLSHPSRFTERVTFELDPADLPSAADAIAHVLTDRAAECAYAVEAALRDLPGRRPAWGEAPVAAVGMSGGAMVLPTVIARDPGRFDAAVYIAGGVDFWRIAQESNYRLWIDSVSWVWKGGQPDGEPGNRAPADALVRELNELYQARAPLDSRRTAPLAAHVPSLLLHGSGDLAVPSALGDDLWSLLGEPERRTLPVGHEVLFMMLPGQFGTIVEWLDQTLAPGQE